MKITTTSDCVKEREARQEEYARKQESEQEEERKTAEIEAARAIEAANLCYRIAQVYLPKEDIDKALAGERITESERKIFEDETTDTLALGYILDGVIYLVFRGTQSLKNWLTDFDCWPIDSPRRHQGFQRAWMSIRDEIRIWIGSHYKENWQLALAGHSLGGALATIAAMDLSVDWPIREVRTYGSPRVGLWGFRKYYSARRAGPKKQESLAKVTTRYVHNADLFPHLPPPLLYCHVKKEELIGSYSWETFITNSSGLIAPSNLVPFFASGSTMTASSQRTAYRHQKVMNISWWCVMGFYAYLQSIRILAKLPMEFWWAIATLTRSIPIAAKDHSSVKHYSDPTLYSYQMSQPPENVLHH